MRPIKGGALLLAAVALLALAGCSDKQEKADNPGGAIIRSSQDPNGLRGATLDQPYSMPATTLTDTGGNPFNLVTSTKKPVTLVFFGYTNCPDVCPTTMADIHNALLKVPAAVQQRTYVVFVSTDVKRDTGPVLTQWLHNFDGGVAATFVGLRGTQAQIDAAQAAAHILVAEDGGQTHSTQVLLYGPDDYARVSYVYSGGDGNEAAQMAHDLPIVAKS